MTSARRCPRPLVTAAFAVLVVAVAGPVTAQLQSGNLYGTVVSDKGEALPGATVELSGPGAPLIQTTDPRGEFRFLGLDPGAYRVAATLDGYSPVVHEKVTVAVGRNTDIGVTMIAAVEDVIWVTAESPVLDERKIGAGATVTRTELEKVPSARDPWVVLSTVPGVLTNDVNVGGNKSGRQQYFTGAGSFFWHNTYAIDGMVITSPVGNFSPTYYDFEAFEEIEVSTGGTDASLVGNGVTLNMVTKRGTNEWRVSARYLVADEGWQADLAPDPGALGEGQEQFAQGSRIAKIEEYGIEGGGPLVRDRLWGWGFYGRNDVDRWTIDDVRAFTHLESYGFKLNAQPSANNSAVAYFHFNTRVVDGQGAGPTRPEPTTVDLDAPSRIFKLEDTQGFGSRFFLTGLVSYVDSGYTRTPKGGIGGLPARIDENFVWHDNFGWSEADRDQEQAKLDGSVFFPTGSLHHEITFGAAYRRAENAERWGWPGDMIRVDFYRSFGYPYNVVELDRQEAYAWTTAYTSLFVQDTLRSGRLTANLGLRYDHQKGRLSSAEVPGVPGFESFPDGTPLLPAVSYEGRDQDFAWDDVTPRLGLTWALGKERDTLLRASYSRFATPMDDWYQYLEWPIGPSWAGFFYDDTNGDGRVTPDEIVCFECGPPDAPFYTNGYDPLARKGIYDVDPRLDGPISDEVILGIEHALMPELVIGLSATWRNEHHFDEWRRLVEENGLQRPHRRSDYELQYVDTVTLPDGSTSEVEVWGLRRGVTDTGRYLVTNGDWETDYLGLNLTLTKRLSKRWMLRGHLSWSDWTFDVPESARVDPNRTDVQGSGWPVDGSPVYQFPITSGWSYRLGGLLQVAPRKRWGFDLAGNVWGRQGYAIPYFVRETTNFGVRTIDVLAVDAVDAYRLPDLHLVDLRLEKPIRFGDFETSVAVECFNVLDRSTVLDRNARLATARTDWVGEVVNPRIFRLTTRLRFR